MRYRILGITGLRVSEIGFGCASFWGKKIFDETAAIRLMHEAAAKGVTFFDTGSSYSGGNAEPRLGRALTEISNKQDLVVSTKAGTCIGAFGRLYKDFAPSSVRASVEQSLRRLGLDVIPLLHLHGPQIPDFTDELLRELERLRQDGKVRHFSVNSFAMEVIRHVMTLPLFGAVMIDYNLMRPEREGIIRDLNQQGLGIFAGMALAGGLYRRRPFQITKPSGLWYALRALKNNRNELRQARHFHFLESTALPASQIALAWVLANPAISCAVFGTTNEAHLREALGTSDIVLDEGLKDKIARAQKAGFGVG